MNKMYKLKQLLLLMMLVSITSLKAQMTTLGSGNWDNPATWSTNAVPTMNDSVLIQNGHTIAISNPNAVCNSFRLGGGTAKIDLNTDSAVLSIYGNFVIVTSTQGPAFASWTPGAKIKFVGSAATQTITGFTANAAPPFAFYDLIIDKPSGKVVTQGNGMRIGFSNSLDIVNGTFELGTQDDIEGRNIAGGSNTQPNIYVRSGCTFNMAGIGTHIRSGTNTGDTTAKIGKLTVWGTVSFTAGQANRINFNDIDIESGGRLEMRNSGSVASSFNPGTITIKNGGSFKTSQVNTNYWYANPTKANAIIVQNGGDLEVNGNADYLPSNITLQAGSLVRYTSNNAQLLSANPNMANYSKLYLVTSAKTLVQNITVDSLLSMRTSNNGVPVVNGFGLTITYSPYATLQYRGLGTSVLPQTTGADEWPTTGSIPTNVDFYNPSGVTLNSNKTTTNITLTGTTSKVFLGANNLTCSTVPNGDTGKYVVTNGAGSLIINALTTDTIPVGRSSYNPVYFSDVNASPVNWSFRVEDTVVNVTPPIITDYAVKRTWYVTPSSARTNVNVGFGFNDSLDAQLFNATTYNSYPSRYAQAFLYNTIWSAAGTPNSLTNLVGYQKVHGLGLSNFGAFSITKVPDPLPIRLQGFTATLTEQGNQLTWSAENTDGFKNFIVEKSIDGRNFNETGSVNITVNNNYSFLDKNINADKTYYRLKMISANGKAEYSNVVFVSKSNKVTGIKIQSVYPNPATDNVKMIISSSINCDANITITDLLGKVVASNKKQLINGNNLVELNTSNLIKGSYFIQVNSKTYNDFTTIIK